MSQEREFDRRRRQGTDASTPDGPGPNRQTRSSQLSAPSSPIASGIVPGGGAGLGAAGAGNAEPDHLESDALANDDRLDGAYHNKPPLQVGEHSDAVGKMQTALADSFDEREVMPITFASGVADGKYGAETARAVREFQSRHNVNPVGGHEAGHKTLGTMDRLLKAKPTPKPPVPPVPPVPPTPQPQAINPELETVLDRIEVAYQNMITRQRDGVQAVFRDLNPLDEQKPSLELQILGALIKGVLTFLYGAGEGKLRLLINSAFSDQSSDAAKVEDNANDKVFDFMWSQGMDFASEQLATGPKKKTDDRSNVLADFSDMELAQVTKAGFLALDAFERDGKNLLRSPAPAPNPAPAPSPQNLSNDPRVPRARDFLRSVNLATAAAFDQHYRAAETHWARELASRGGDRKLEKRSFGGGTEQDGFTPKIDPSTGQTVIDPDTNQPVMVPHMVAKQSLDLSPLKQGGPLELPPRQPGVIDVTMIGDLPGAPIKLTNPKVDGLSTRTRAQLEEKTVAQAGISVVAHANKFRSPSPIDPSDPNFGILTTRQVTVGINEVGAVFNLTDEFGEDWLDQEGGGDATAGAKKVADAIKPQQLTGLDAG